MESSVLSKVFLVGSLFIIMLGMGLSLVPADFKRVFAYPKAIVTGLTNQLLFLPLLGFGLASIFTLTPELAVGLIILAACPGGPTSNLITHLAKGDTALSVSLTAVTSLITIFTIPFIVNLGLDQFMGTTQVIKLNVVETIAQIMVITVIPISIGMLIRAKNAPFAHKMNRPVKIASTIVLALVIAAIIVKERDNFFSFFEQAGLAALGLNLSSMIIGFATAIFFRLNTKQATAIGIETGIQNGTLAIAVATTMLNNAQMAITPAVYSLIMFATGGVVIGWFGRRTSGSVVNI
jgi:bile acid:Na+ symporter, BASS family